MLNRYTYAESQCGNYYCSSKTRLGCRARVKLDKNGRILQADEKHSHQPPNYFKTKTGAYIKL